MLMATSLTSLPNASRPFLTPLAESVLREFAALFYAEEKANETKSDPNYVSSSAKTLIIVLQAMPEVQESQGFKTLRGDLTAELENFRVKITKDYVLKANDLNVEAKRTRFHFAICKWMRGLAAAFIAQTGVTNYNEDVAIMDLIAVHQDDVLASLAIPLPKFLAAYKAANNLLGGSHPQPSTSTLSTRRSAVRTVLPASRLPLQHLLQQLKKLPSSSATPKDMTSVKVETRMKTKK